MSRRGTGRPISRRLKQSEVMATTELASAARSTRLEAGGTNQGDQIFRGLVRVFAIASVVTLGLLIALLLFDSKSAIGRFGLSFLTTSVWDPVFEQFGAWPYIYGTLVTSAVAVVISAPIAIGAAIYLAEY